MYQFQLTETMLYYKIADTSFLAKNSKARPFIFSKKVLNKCFRNIIKEVKNLNGKLNNNDVLYEVVHKDCKVMVLFEADKYSFYIYKYNEPVFTLIVDKSKYYLTIGHNYMCNITDMQKVLFPKLRRSIHELNLLYMLLGRDQVGV